MNSFWASLLMFGVLLAGPALGRLLGVLDERAEERRLAATPRRYGSANGTGVEHGQSCGYLRRAAGLPRSPQAPTGVVAPRPTTPVGPQSPVGMTGRRHGLASCPPGQQSPAGAADLYALSQSPGERGGSEHPPVAFTGLQTPVGVQWPVASTGPRRVRVHG